MTELEELKKDVTSLKERNMRVETDKAWETSAFRTLSISLATYVIAGLVFGLLDAAHPWRNALIPTIGYFLSTRSLPFIKKRWMDHLEAYKLHCIDQAITILGAGHDVGHTHRRGQIRVPRWVPVR